MSVLLVEDDPLIREFVVEALREAGYHVIHASTGEEALAWCEHHVALVTDVRLPGQVDGWQIAERYREQDPNLPVIYATGFSPTPPRPRQPHREQALPSGGDRPDNQGARRGKRGHRLVSCSTHGIAFLFFKQFGEGSLRSCTPILRRACS
ncbi:response regulator [Bradyrhizobium sp. Leo121]|uniref:response regulator n=1 Tax=Bradyrhizobium sp. Leo121 TaxID=1571195 RepID=UPI001FDF8C5D|nr:response regulator [Bradyrhizobium sp. Leo121]